MTTLQRARLEPLAEDECLRLLSLHGVGRIAVVIEGQPLIFPVNYALGRTPHRVPDRRRDEAARGGRTARRVRDRRPRRRVSRRLERARCRHRARRAQPAHRKHALEKLPLRPWVSGAKASLDAHRRRWDHRVAGLLISTTPTPRGIDERSTERSCDRERARRIGNSTRRARSGRARDVSLPRSSCSCVPVQRPRRRKAVPPGRGRYRRRAGHAPSPEPATDPDGEWRHVRDPSPRPVGRRRAARAEPVRRFRGGQHGLGRRRRGELRTRGAHRRRLRALTAAQQAMRDTLDRRGIDATPNITIRRIHGSLHVHVTGTAMLDEPTKSMLAVRISGAVRAADRDARGIDVMIS